MEEEISDRESRVKPKRVFDRLLPKGGIDTEWIYTNTYKFHYVDYNDTPEESKEAQRVIESKDPCKAIKYSINYARGIRDRQFRIFAYYEWRILGIFTMREMLDNPHGYGKNDFLYQKYIYPEYRNTKLVRFTTSDINHLVFKSGIVKRLYGYMKAKEEVKEEEQLWDKIDRTANANPGMAKIYSVDGPQTQTYITIPNILDTDQGKFAIVEIDGEKFNAMDYEEYHKKSTPSHPVIKSFAFENWNRNMEKNVDKLLEVRQKADKERKKNGEFNGRDLPVR